jgi:hypothetical protein
VLSSSSEESKKPTLERIGDDGAVDGVEDPDELAGDGNRREEPEVDGSLLEALAELFEFIIRRIFLPKSFSKTISSFNFQVSSFNYF